MSKPVVSVVVPVFNARRWIAATLDSALAQTLKQIEVIVVDDGSTDDTAGVVEAFTRRDPRVRLIPMQNAGVGAARNTGIKASVGEFIAPLDADDLWDPSKLEKQVGRLRESGDKAGLVYCWSRLIDEEGEWIKDGSSFEVEGGARKAIILRNFIGNASVPLFRKTALDEVGLYLTREEQGGVQGLEDWDLTIRLAEKREIALVPEFLVEYRQTRGCMSAGIEGMTGSFWILQQRARERNRDIPASLFRWAGGWFLGYMVSKSYQECDYHGCLMSIARSFQKDPFTLLSRRLYKLACKSLVFNANVLRTHPRSATQWTQVKPPAGQVARTLIQRIHDSRWRKTLAECGIPYTSGKSLAHGSEFQHSFMNFADQYIETSLSPAEEQREAARRIKVADLEMSKPLTGFTHLRGYAKMWLFLRWHGRPFARIVVPVRGDRCTPADIIRELKDPHYALWIREVLTQGVLHEVPSSDWNLARFLELKPRPRANLPSISVVVCSRDRSEDLSLCLESLRKLETKPFEILLIDNAPKTSATRELIERSYPEVRYVLEPRPGLDWARNRAIHEASGEIIAYTDDDVLVDPLWTRALAEVFAADENIMAATGLVAPFELETEAQRQFEEYGGFDRGYTRKWHRVDAGRTRNMARRYAGTGQFGTGANMAYRRSVFSEIGLFDPAMDVGTVTNGGGDLDMFFRVLRHGHTLVYEPAAMVWHRHRRTYGELRKQIANNGIGFYAYLVRNAMAWPDQRRGLFKLGVWWFYFWSIRRLLKSWYKPPMIPRDLIIVELKGVFTGLFRYQKARKNARRVIEEHGDHPEFVLQPPARHHGEERPGTAVRTLEVTSAAASIDDVAAYRSTELFLAFDGVAVGRIVIENCFRKLCQERVVDEITGKAMAGLMEPRGEIQDRACFGEWIAELRHHIIGRSVPMPPADPAMPSVSVVIATCDRPDDLRRALASLKRQKFSRSFEIVVVDNRPDSGLTPPVVAEFAGIRLVKEPRGGSSYARNAGFAAAIGEIIVCTDDDLALPANWLENTLCPFARNDVVMMTGNVLPAELETHSQIEFESYGGLSRGFRSRDFDRKWFDTPGQRVVPTWKIGATANAAFRAWILRDPEIGMMNEALGAGVPTGTGEDTYLFYKVLRAGYILSYAPASHAWHHHRATDESLDRQIYAYSKGHVAYHLITFLCDGDTRGLIYLLSTLPKYHLKQLYCWIRGSRRRALRTILLEILGNLMGGFALWSSLRRVKKLGRSQPIHAHAPAAETILEPQ